MGDVVWSYVETALRLVVAFFEDAAKKEFKWLFTEKK